MYTKLYTTKWRYYFSNKATSTAETDPTSAETTEDLKIEIVQWRFSKKAKKLYEISQLILCLLSKFQINWENLSKFGVYFFKNLNFKQ